MISIVTISYNQRDYLARCIDSVLSQNDVELEYIVVDAGSTDGSRELIESYGDQLTAISEKDDGPADGLNKGFLAASGGIFGFLNADDFFLPGALSKVIEYFNEHAECDMVSAAGYVEYGATGKRKEVFPDSLTKNGLLYNSKIIFQQGTFFRFEIYKKVGGFNASNKTCWDMELFLDMISSGARHCLLQNKIAVFFVHEKSITGSGRLNQQYKIERNKIFYKNKSRDWCWYDNIFTMILRIKQKIIRFFTIECRR